MAADVTDLVILIKRFEQYQWCFIPTNGIILIINYHISIIRYSTIVFKIEYIAATHGKIAYAVNLITLYWISIQDFCGVVDYVLSNRIKSILCHPLYLLFRTVCKTFRENLVHMRLVCSWLLRNPYKPIVSMVIAGALVIVKPPFPLPPLLHSIPSISILLFTLHNGLWIRGIHTCLCMCNMREEYYGKNWLVNKTNTVIRRQEGFRVKLIRERFRVWTKGLLGTSPCL